MNFSACEQTRQHVCVWGGRWLSPSLTRFMPSLWPLSYTVPPSKPDCGIQGETVIGNNIQLTCQSKEGSPAPQYSWKSYDLLNRERTGPPGNGVTREGRAITSLCSWPGPAARGDPGADRSGPSEGSFPTTVPHLQPSLKRCFLRVIPTYLTGCAEKQSDFM